MTINPGRASTEDQRRALKAAVYRAIRRLVAEWRDVELSALDALGDGHITPREKKALRKEIAELRAALDEFESKVEAS